MSIRELIYQKKHLNQVIHTTLNPYGPGVVRIHMIPPKVSWFRPHPSIIILNGQDLLPLNLSWTILLSCFISELNKHGQSELTNVELTKIIDKALIRTQSVYPEAKYSQLKLDLLLIIDTLCDVAYGRTPDVEIGYMSLREYAPYMRAPHRMDLMVSAMTKDGSWHCNQRCLHCYAANQPLSEGTELTTSDWKQIIDRCKEVGIPQLTFTGGEPTLSNDLFELIYHARWFVTRLNTNGVLLTREYCEHLYKAELDSVQITFYSSDQSIHNQLVGANHYERTVAGIKNALTAGLNVSVNTPLCTLNADYLNTLKFLHQLGIQYVTCSGLIVTGNATLEASKVTQLSSQDLYHILETATNYCHANKMEISFTSPGWLSEDNIKSLGLIIPSCGACLSNMAITPDGTVIPCQSWLKQDAGLGKMQSDSWKSIWNSPKCATIRNDSRHQEQRCPLRTEMEVK